MDWRDTQWQERGVREYPWTMPSMQVTSLYRPLHMGRSATRSGPTLQSMQTSIIKEVFRRAAPRGRGPDRLSSTPPVVQVYASYKYRRDLVEAVKLPGMLGRSRPLTSSEADAQVAHFP